VFLPWGVRCKFPVCSWWATPAKLLSSHSSKLGEPSWLGASIARGQGGTPAPTSRFSGAFTPCLVAAGYYPQGKLKLTVKDFSLSALTSKSASGTMVTP
jgi:hypothetical protein